jgi:DNA-directed RNA polymerase-3 subunit RPC5
MPVRIKSDPDALPEATDVDDESDEIVREIDVFLSPELASQIYLLQYPLEHGKAPMLPTEARIKPLHNIMELIEPFPPNAELQGEYRELEHRTFQSHTIPVQTHLCVGKLKENHHGSTELHLVPLNHIIQMRPSFQHIAAQKKEEMMYDSDDETMPIVEDDKSKQSRPVIFQRKESDRAASARISSYAYKLASEEEEDWVELEVCDEHSMEFHSSLAKVFCTTPEQCVIENDHLSNVAYVESLNYLPKDTVDLRSKPESGVTDLRSLVDSLTTLLLGGRPIPFSIIRDHIPSQVSNLHLFTVLSACSILVRGNYCILSKLLALPRPMQLARTFILMLLNQETLERARLERAFRSKVSPERLLSLLRETGKQVRHGWVLKVEEDFSFQARYPDQVTAFQKVMDSLEVRFENELRLYRSD